jgi:cell division protein FtsB
MVIFLLFVSGLLAVAVWYLPLIKQNEALRKEVLRLDTEIQKGEETQKRLRASIEGLRHDPKAIERVAREKLGFAKPTETVIRFQETKRMN